MSLGPDWVSEALLGLCGCSRCSNACNSVVFGTAYWGSTNRPRNGHLGLGSYHVASRNTSYVLVENQSRRLSWDASVRCFWGAHLRSLHTYPHFWPSAFRLNLDLLRYFRGGQKQKRSARSCEGRNGAARKLRQRRRQSANSIEFTSRSLLVVARKRISCHVSPFVCYSVSSLFATFSELYTHRAPARFGV